MVVPAISLTTNLSSLIKLFIKVDLPALGLPSTATFLPSGRSIVVSGTLVSICDFNKFKFLECSALIFI